MKDFTNEHVKCFLRNSVMIEGIVIDWTTTQVQLQSLDGESILIIHNPSQDIILTKVLQHHLPRESSENLPTKPESSVPTATLEEAFQLLATEDPEPDEEINPISLRVKTVAELKIELAKEERRIVSQKLKTHQPETPKKVQYSYPNFFKKDSKD